MPATPGQPTFKPPGNTPPAFWKTGDLVEALDAMMNRQGEIL